MAPSAQPQDSFLPSFCSIPMTLGVVLGAQLLAFVLILAAGWPEGQFWERLSLLSLYVQWISLGTAGLLCLLRQPLRRLPDLSAGLAVWGSLLAVTALVAELTHGLGASVPALALQEPSGRWDLLLRSLGISGVVGALVLRYFYLHSQWRRQQIARSEARFQALQARIRPHFLFNSMNTVASLTRTDPGRAEAVVEDLADLFRAALADPAGGSTLGQEVELVRRYLNVERHRLGERLRLEWDLDPSLPLEAPLPLLVLQPLVENAVYHGIEPSADPGVVRIAGRFREGRVNLSVRNSVPAHLGPGAHRVGNRMALDNVRQRLEALYPGKGRLTLGRVEGEFQVRLVFPFGGGPG